jgi:antitoxin (DNA-binding transcriptional repressor) of toxin-antitoxin stability system
MRSVGVRELKERTSQVLQELQARGEEIEVTQPRARGRTARSRPPRAGPAPHGNDMVDARSGGPRDRRTLAPGPVCSRSGS